MSEDNPKGQGRHRLGEWRREKPGEGSTVQADARALFLLSLRRVAPEAMKDLAGEPYELISKAIAERGDVEERIRLALPFLLSGSDPGALEWLYTPEAVRAASGISVWGNRWNLGAAWVLDQAVQTLAIWLQTFGLRERHDWGPFYNGFMIYEPPSVAVRGWNPYEETESEARNRMMKEFKLRLTQHLDSTREDLAVQAFERAPRKSAAEHFEWLVRYQVLGDSYRAIADDVGRDVQTVREAIDSTCRLIGIPLRPPEKGGRPKGSRTVNRVHY